MIKYLRNLTLLFLLPLFLISINCSKEVTKEKNEPNIEKPDTIPPSHANITGTIMEIEPVLKNTDGPCSQYPCIASVKIESIQYGSAFPVISPGNVVRIKFAFTLNKTTQKLFPNMDESYPGLKVGEKFEALVGHSENAQMGMENKNLTSFNINGYKIIN